MIRDLKKKSLWSKFVLAAILICADHHAQAPLIAGKTNALLWGNLTPHFSLELVTSDKTSVMAGAFYSLDQNPLDCSIKGAEGQVRYWVSGRPMVQSFIGLGVQAMRYDAVFSDTRHFGDAAGPGLVYGYVLPLGKRFNIEFSAGISMMWYREKRYGKGMPEPGDYNTTGHKIMPMGLGVSCTYIFK